MIVDSTTPPPREVSTRDLGRALPAGLERRRPGAHPRDRRRRGDARPTPCAPPPRPPASTRAASSPRSRAPGAAQRGSTPRSRVGGDDGLGEAGRAAPARPARRTTPPRSSCRCSCPTPRSWSGGPGNAPDVPGRRPGRPARPAPHHRRQRPSTRPLVALQSRAASATAPATPTWPGPASPRGARCSPPSLDQPYDPITGADGRRRRRNNPSGAAARRLAAARGSASPSTTARQPRAGHHRGRPCTPTHGDIRSPGPTAGWPPCRGRASRTARRPCTGARRTASSPRSCAASTRTTSTARPSRPCASVAPALARDSPRRRPPAAASARPTSSARRPARARDEAPRLRASARKATPMSTPEVARPPRRRHAGRRPSRPGWSPRIVERRRPARGRAHVCLTGGAHRHRRASRRCATPPARDAVDWSRAARVVGRRAVPARRRPRPQRDPGARGAARPRAARPRARAPDARARTAGSTSTPPRRSTPTSCAALARPRTTPRCPASTSAARHRPRRATSRRCSRSMPGGARDRAHGRRRCTAPPSRRRSASRSPCPRMHGLAEVWLVAAGAEQGRRAAARALRRRPGPGAGRRRPRPRAHPRPPRRGRRRRAAARAPPHRQPLSDSACTRRTDRGLTRPPAAGSRPSRRPTHGPAPRERAFVSGATCRGAWRGPRRGWPRRRRRCAAPSRRRGASCRARSWAPPAGSPCRGPAGRPQRGQSHVSGTAASVGEAAAASRGRSRTRTTPDAAGRRRRARPRPSVRRRPGCRGSHCHWPRWCLSFSSVEAYGRTSGLEEQAEPDDQGRPTRAPRPMVMRSRLRSASAGPAEGGGDAAAEHVGQAAALALVQQHEEDRAAG